MQARNSLSALGLAAALAGCGGGGGDPTTDPLGNEGGAGGNGSISLPAARTLPASPNADLTPGNYGSMSASAVQAVLTSLGSGTALESPLSADAKAAAAEDGTRAGLAPHRLTAQLVDWAAQQAGRAVVDAGRMHALAVATQTFACAQGGSFKVTFDDVANDRKLSPTDSMTLVFANCVEIASVPAVNGSFKMVINAVELGTDDQPRALDASATYTSLSVQGYGQLTGGARTWTVPFGDGKRSLTRYDGLQVTLGGTTLTLDLDITESVTSTAASLSFSGAITMQSLGQTFQVTQTTAFSGTATGAPQLGTLRMADAAGDAVEIHAHDGLVDRNFYPAGATSPSLTLPNTPWSSFRLN